MNYTYFFISSPFSLKMSSFDDKVFLILDFQSFNSSILNLNALPNNKLNPKLKTSIIITKTTFNNFKGFYFYY